MSSRMSFAMYRPRPGKETELMELVREHLPTMRNYGLITGRDSYLAQSTDGTVIEVFEWASADSSRLAHEHPAIAAIWEKMSEICDFPAMRDLPESGGRFPNFDMLSEPGDA